MTRTRKWAMGTAALVVLILLAGWFLLVSPKKADAADLQTQALAQEAKNGGLRIKIKLLQEAEKGKPAAQAELAQIQTQIPGNPQLPALIRQLNSLAKSAGVQINGLVPANPAGVNVAPPALVGVAADAGVYSGTTLEQISVAITFAGSYYNIERFVNSVEQSHRLAMVTGINIKSGTSAGATSTDGSSSTSGYTAVVQARVFMTTPNVAPAPAAGATTAPATSGAASPTTVQ